MALQNPHESSLSDYLLSTEGQLALRVGGSDWPPIRRTRPVGKMVRSPAEIDRERELVGHQITLDGFRNVIVDAIREHADRTFFDQPTPVDIRSVEPPVEIADRIPGTDLIELPLPTTGHDVEIRIDRAA